MHRLFSLTLLVPSACLLLLAACGHSSPPTPSVVTFTAADASHSLSVHPQQPFQIFLHDCGSDGGYLWTASIASPSLLAQVGDPTRQPYSDLPGAGASYTFHFLALAKGQAALTFNCARAWETRPPDPTISFLFTIV